jgi:MFS family permease
MNDPVSRTIPVSARAVLLLSSTMTVMAGAMIAPGLPGMKRAFAQVPEIDLWVGLVLSSPAISIVVAGVAMGWLVERVGARNVLAASLVLFALAGSAGLWLDTLDGILVSRLILGLAVGGIMTAATTLIAECFTGIERRAFMGFQAAFMGLGGVIFLVMGGLLAMSGWRGPFAVYLAGLLLAPFVIRLLPRSGCAAVGGVSGDEREPAPWLEIGFLLSVAFLGLLVFFVIPVHVPFRIAAATGGGSFVTGAVLGALQPVRRDGGVPVPAGARVDRPARGGGAAVLTGDRRIHHPGAHPGDSRHDPGPGRCRRRLRVPLPLPDRRHDRRGPGPHARSPGRGTQLCHLPRAVPLAVRGVADRGGRGEADGVLGRGRRLRPARAGLRGDVARTLSPACVVVVGLRTCQRHAVVRLVPHLQRPGRAVDREYGWVHDPVGSVGEACFAAHWVAWYNSQTTATVYIETTIPSVSVTTRPDPASRYRRDRTRDWWSNQCRRYEA